MIEIIPNWHPIFVHFTIALFSISVILYVLTYISNHLRIFSKTILMELEIVSRWCLWMASFVTIGTVLAGLYAYNTVRHDAVSHAAMTVHRNWALCTAATILVIASWSAWRHYNRKSLNITFIIALFIAGALVLVTAWRGSELVYRYGLGVMSMPKFEGEEGHNHHHEEETNESGMDHSKIPAMEHHEQSNHPHDHKQ